MLTLIALLIALGVTLAVLRRIGRPVPVGGLAAIAGLLVLAWVAFQSILVVPPGMVAVEVLFGAVKPGFRSEGLGLVNPLARFELVNARRQTVDFTPNNGDAPTVVAMSADRNTLFVDASIPYRVEPALAWKLYQRIGRGAAIKDSLVLPAARSAVRTAIARFGWVEAGVERRDEIARVIEESLRATLAMNLQENGFTATEARAAVVVAPVLLRDVRPDQKVLNAISEKVAAEEDLKRQRVLTEIARQEAERRANEGLGVARLFAELPTGFSPDQIRSVLAALADKQRADALMKAVETGKVNVMVLPATTPVAVSAP